MLRASRTSSRHFLVLASRRQLLSSLHAPLFQYQCRNASSEVGVRGYSMTKRWTIGLFSGGALLAAALISLPTIRAEAVAAEPTKEMTLGELVRAYAVFTMCSFPTLVDNSQKLLQFATAPGISWFGERFVRWTFFDQFVGGDTAEKTLPLLYKLRTVNKGALFAYSVEVDESEATGSALSKKESSPHKRIVEEMIHCVDIAADFEDGVSGKHHSGRRTWVAIKMSALLPDANILVKFSSHLLNSRPTRSIVYPGCPHSSDLDVLNKPPTGAFTTEDITALRDFHDDLIRICQRAQERGVKIIVDAEYSWYQPAIDALTLSLTRQFNKLPSSREDKEISAVQPLIYGTYQAYLQRTPELLAQSLADAKAGNYALGVKLVRGAYHSYEVAAYKARLEGAPSHLLSSESTPPVWLTKTKTDECYNACARMLVREIREDVDVQRGKRKGRGLPGLGVLFGTHNWGSCDVILGELLRSGLAVKGGTKGELLVVPDDVTERMAIGQLYGMCDDLTNYLVNSTASATPLIIKYVPYGALSEVMPYLSRRAIENKSILGEGAAAVERRRAGDEIKKRLFGSWYSSGK